MAKKYVVQTSVGGKTISSHHLLRSAEKKLKSYLRSRAASGDRVRMYSVGAPRTYVHRQSGLLTGPLRIGVVEDANGREKKRPYACVVRVED